MTSLISHTTVDCSDAYTLSRWWQAVLDYVDDPDDPNEPGHEECMISSRDGTHRLLFIEVPEGKIAEPRTGRRIHLDVMPTDVTRDEEVKRLLAVGATEYEDHRTPDGAGWVTLADPEGNLFCVERSAAERV